VETPFNQLNIDRDSPVPAYRQIAEQMRTLITNGALSPGQRVPPTRELAVALKASRVTVLRGLEILIRSGLAEAKVGDGTYITGRLDAPHAHLYLERLTSDGPRAMFERFSKHGRISSLATSVPDPELFRPDEWLFATNCLAKSTGWDFYMSPEVGHPALLKAVMPFARMLCETCTENQVLISGGSLQALNCALGTFLKAGDRVLTLAPISYVRPFVLDAIGIEDILVDARTEHPDIDEIARLMDVHRPRVILCASIFNHVTGLSIAPEAQAEIRKLAEKYSAVIIDFSPAALVDQSNEREPIIFENCSTPCVFITGFESVISPSLSLGLTLCSPSVRDSLARSQFYQTQGVSTFMQAAFAHYIAESFLINHLRRAHRTYAERRHALWQAVTSLKMIPKPAEQPRGGYSMLVPLPHEIDPQEVYQELLDLGFAVVPGPNLWTKKPAPYIRMSHSLQPPERIRSAVEALGKVISAKAQ